MLSMLQESPKSKTSLQAIDWRVTLTKPVHMENVEDDGNDRELLNIHKTRRLHEFSDKAKSINQFFLPCWDKCLNYLLGESLAQLTSLEAKRPSMMLLTNIKTSLTDWENFREGCAKLVLDKRNIREHHQIPYLYRRRGLRVYVSE